MCEPVRLETEDAALSLFTREDDLDALLGKVAHGDQRAFARLYQLAAPKLFGLVLRILRRRDWAEEVLQEVFVVLWRQAGDFAAAKSAPMTWMTHIARNRAIDAWRRARHEGPSLDEGMLEALVDPDPLPDARAGLDRDAQRLNRCLEGLVESQQQCIRLAYVEGLSHAELATRLSVPLGSVKTWIRRGLQVLKECMQA